MILHEVPTEERLASLQVTMEKLVLLMILACSALREVQQFSKQEIASLLQRFLCKLGCSAALPDNNPQLHVIYQILANDI